MCSTICRVRLECFFSSFLPKKFYHLKKLHVAHGAATSFASTCFCSLHDCSRTSAAACASHVTSNAAAANAIGHRMIDHIYSLCLC